jgi:hypothetical protein
MLRHEFGKNLVLGLDFLLQIGDPLLFAEWLDGLFGSKAAAPFSKNSFCQR